MLEIPGVNIDFFGKPLCSDCDAAKKVFEDVGVGFNYRDIKSDPKAQEELTNICQSLGRDPATPVIVISHQGEIINSRIVFIEPRGLDLRVLESALSTLRK